MHHMNLSHISKGYFIGVGGIGVSAVIRLFAERGIMVLGSDITLPEPGTLPDGQYFEGVDANQSDTDLLADVVEEWDERAALVATLERQYNDVTRALGKVKEGTYGICEVGGEPIEEDRLGANPAARTCKAHMNDEGSLTT